MSLPDFTILSFSKLNLFLNIKRRLDDGYHEIESLFQSIDLADNIEVKIKESGSDEVFFKNIEVEPSNNTLVRTLKLIRTRISSNRSLIPPLTVKVEKNIPAGSGLGGASSNAAALIELLNSKFNLGLSQEEKIEIGAEIGADVPYFFYGGLCRVSGKGEKIKPLYVDLDAVFLLVFPGEAVETRKAYELWDLYGNYQEKDVDKAAHLISKGIFRKGESLYNSFESILPFISKRAYEALEYLTKKGYPAALSGSGSTVFVPLKDTKEIDEKILFELKEKGFNIFFAKTIARGAMEID